MATPLQHPGEHPAGPVPQRGGAPPSGVGGVGIANGRIAVAMLLATETMFFAGLIGAYLVLRYGTTNWPPPGQPRLPLAVTWVNTFVLIGSGVTMWLSMRSARAGERERMVNALGLTSFLGALFLLVQGSEWVRLLSHGLTLSSSTYGATFYTLIGFHGLHVVAALVWLLVIYRGARRGRHDGGRSLGVELCGTYWEYVVGVWIALFWLVYLA